MIYKYTGNDNIEMLASYNFEDLGGTEKDLENLLAKNLGDLYSENGQLMPIFQERKWQAEPDLCALDKDGNLIIFELKRGTVLGDTTIQVMRYAQEFGQFNYFDLNKRYADYINTQNECELRNAHAEAFGLEKPLNIDEFNRKQRLVVIGSSADKELIDAVMYWKNNGIDIEYIPYRFYKINNEVFFEFFAKPFDYHINVSDIKGILFDTNRTYDSGSIWDMFRNSKVSAYGSVKGCVKSFNKGDYVLYYHKGWGVVGAGIIKSGKAKEIPSNKEMYMEVELLTPQVTSDDELKYVSVSELKELLHKNFYLAKTTKVPYLTEKESLMVVDLLKAKYGIQ